MFALIVSASAMCLSCAAVSCRSVSTSAGRELSIWHSSGGLAPIVSSLVITSQGQVLYLSPRRKRFCGQLGQLELASVKRLIARQDLRRSAIEAQRQGAGYADYEEVGIDAGSWSATMPLEITPPEVRELLLEIDSILRDLFGKRAPWMDSLAKPAVVESHPGPG